MFDHQLRTAVRLCLIGVICTVAAGGCGSTGVYEAHKTVVYGGKMYNVSDTKQFTATEEGRLPDGQTVDLKNLDNKKIQKLLKEQGGIAVRMAFHFDDTELLYNESTVTSWSEFDRKQRDFERAAKQIKDLMDKRGATQVILK